MEVDMINPTQQENDMNKTFEKEIIEEFEKRYQSFEFGEPISKYQFNVLRAFLSGALHQQRIKDAEEFEVEKKIATWEGKLEAYRNCVAWTNQVQPINKDALMAHGNAVDQIEYELSELRKQLEEWK